MQSARNDRGLRLQRSFGGFRPVPLSKALEYCEDPIVSCDIIGNPHGSIFDAAMTMSAGKFVKVFSWYDNEWGFSNRMIDMIKMML